MDSWLSGAYQWQQGDETKFLKPVATHICVLTRVQGKFEGTGESLRVSEDGTYWFITGTSKQQGVAGEAYCLARARMVPDTGQTSTQLEYCDGSRCFYNGTKPWEGDAATMISGIMGAFHGNGEYVAVGQSASASVPSTLVTKTHTGTPLWGFAHSVRFRPTVSNWTTNFTDPNGVDGKVLQTPEVSASGSAGAAILAPVGRAICYFTGIQGGFFSANESVQIGPERIGPIDYWVLRTKSVNPTANITAHARCISRAQQ